MPKFVECTYVYHGPEKTTWVNLDFVASITEAPDLIYEGPDGYGGEKTREGDMILYVNVPGSDLKYKIKDPAQMQEVKDYLARSLEERS